ncbi:MAG: TetR/AcrR family transcriptional regulator [Myxococcales bacterium]|nr:TetR/AcrR family transcriptional regulator [Myxococcales bacterium]
MGHRVRTPPRRTKRLRRSAEEAREQILDAAEKRLDGAGPAGIRLQEIAADVGVSHPTILHHFGNRQALVEAVVGRALEGVRRDALAAFTAEGFEAPDVAALLRRIVRTLADRGHARLLAWLALEGRPQEDPDHLLGVLADVIHARRVAGPHPTARREDTLFIVVLASLALLAEGIVGRLTWDSARLAGDAGAPERFHAWLVDLLAEHMHRAAAPAPKTPRPRAAPKPRR